MTTPNDLAVRCALEAAGVEFIDANGEVRDYVYDDKTSDSAIVTS